MNNTFNMPLNIHIYQDLSIFILLLIVSMFHLTMNFVYYKEN